MWVIAILMPEPMPDEMRGNLDLLESIVDRVKDTRIQGQGHIIGRKRPKTTYETMVHVRFGFL